ncbi:MAG: carboxypeptidase-like regulatory domain-containing protein, partial [Bacteroidia bacterium]
MYRSIIISVFLVVFLTPAHSQGIRGKITDLEGEPVPFAAIYVKELTRGTTNNALGTFSLPLPRGTYTIFFRSLGYTEVTRTIEIGEDFVLLNIELPPQTYMIPEVRVSASGEDPAYWIMRKTIGLANYHLNEVLKYHAEIYIKGSAIAEKIPKVIQKRIQVEDFNVKEDEAYMLESFNEVQFNAPDKYEMRVIASQNTLPGYTDNVNPMDYINASLYQEEIEGVISPLARNAFSHYRFEFEGTFMEGSHIINKIKVIPKRKSQQLMSGTLYIVEDIWCLHSSDLSVNTIAGTVYLQQLYANVIMDAWLPVSHKMSVDIDIIGIKAKATYVSSLKYSDVTLNPNLPETYFTSTTAPIDQAGEIPAETPEVSEEQEKINALLKKEELTNRDVQKLSKLMEKETGKGDPDNLDRSDELDQTRTSFSVEDDALKTDSLYWNKVRPIPLTPEEHLTIRERDSIMGPVVRTTSSDTSRIASSRRKKKPFSWIAMGHTYNGNQGRIRFSHGGLFDLDMLGYNTVDGLHYGQDLTFNLKLDSAHILRSWFKASYAFHRKAPMVTWNWDFLYAPMRRAKVALYLSYTSSDFNQNSGIPKFTNLAYTLFLRENYLKKYEHIDATLYNRIDLANGLILTTSAKYAQLNQLDNNVDFSFFYRNKKDFTENTPWNYPADDPSLADSEKLLGEIQLDYTPRQYYLIRNGRKELRDSQWPTFSLIYRHAFPLENIGWADFNLISLEIDHSLDAGLFSTFDWSLSSGYFLSNNAIHFSDYKHFKSSPLYVDMAGLDDALMLMDYYEASTSDYWFNASVRFSSSYLLIKFLPWFSERLWKESIGITYLYT